MRRKLKDRNTRKIYKHGDSLGITLPKEFLKTLKWRKGQKVTLSRRGKKITISDWEK